MDRLYPNYKKVKMTKEQFFYAHKELAKTVEKHILLESGRTGNLCIAGVDPLVTLKATGDQSLELQWRDGSTEVKKGEPLELLAEFVESMKMETLPELPEYQGGVIGFISYDYARTYEPIPEIAKDDLETPDVFFYLFDRWAVLNQKEEAVYFMTLPGRGLDVSELEQEWLEAAAAGERNRIHAAESTATESKKPEKVNVSVTGPQFEQMVRDVQRYIALGEVNQVNLSVRQSNELAADPLSMYEALRSFNPSPYMAMIGAEDFAVVSGSPELLLKKRGTELSTRPIGGTRPRGATQLEDDALEKDLLSNEKEKGEHIMLVEQELEDFEHVCTKDTVETDEFMVIERYSHVMHLVSNIRGTASPELSNAAIVKGVFPGGSITGSPKLRTMEIIEELEPTRRGLYTGSIGWVGFNGDMELNIVIRTAYIKNGVAYIQAGAGLVADSVPKEEYVESLNKAKALWQAKEMAETKA
ncbi:anthranilate synthase component I family protein [Sporosarcina highlanderae]|uniref:Anthranilate synthase component I family protein n=1 Tax=Sporosarcina highlanderae TaxID=3035916 RepID=A0ABT8JUI1_9BACL|nr:anthranilate synthase component I family protein [Sporosarcina highlanderae]MDN4608829.1 anthranilate synthase component I family protein [Sporosarcina highlanderae]